MNNNYKILDIKIEQLYVNPDNARFINTKGILNEISAINSIISLKPEHVIFLSEDIAINGLNLNELPIVMYNSEMDYYLVMDGNRRISSIKLMTQYADKLDSFNLTNSQKEKLKSLKCDIESVRCIVYYDEEYINKLLEKIHTSKPGIGQVSWDPLAQDRHQEKAGTMTKRLAIVKFLYNSKYTDSETKKILFQEGWLSKLDRYESNKYMFYFGIKFDSDNNILLYIDEKEVIKGLSQLIIDLQNNVSNAIAQTEDVRLTYIANFPEPVKPDFSKKNDPLIKFDPRKEEFVKTNIKNECEEVIYDIDLTEYIGRGYKFTYTNYENKSENLSNSTEKTDAGDNSSGKTNASDSNKTTFESSKENNTDNNKSSSQNNKTDDTNNIGSSNENNEEKNVNDPIYSTEKRTTLIPKEEKIPITEQRVADLYEELKLINVNRYVNVVSISLRSLLEFSLNCFLIKKNHTKLVYNPKTLLIEKLQKVLSILESKIGKKELKREMPALYMWLDTYETDKSKSHISSIAGLNILIHSHLYHPNANELKTIYNNYAPFLKILWENI